MLNNMMCRIALPILAVIFAVTGCAHQHPHSAQQPQASDSTAQAATRLTDFTDATSNQRWQMVNDNVMGGRSKGSRSFDDGIMTVTGDINTNGGGFSSVRSAIPAGTLTNTKAIRLRLRADGRTYRLLVQDNIPRRRSIIFRSDLPLDPNASPEEWQTVTIHLDDLIATHHGDPVNASSNGGPLDRSRAVRIGLMLNDTHDGPFRLQADWIELIPE